MNENKKPRGFYLIKTYGCQMNDHDSEVLAGMLENMGYIPAGSADKTSDIVLINTCCVRKTAENKVYSLLGRLRRLKAENPDMIIGVCGCMVQQEGMAARLRRYFPYVNLIFGTYNLHMLPEIIEKFLEKREPVQEIWTQSKELIENLPVKRKEGIRAWVNITYGCNNFCSYCIVPYVKGRERSRQPEVILNEVEKISRLGYKEVVLLGQNVNSYGKDLKNEIDFAGLLGKMESIKGIERIRYMTSHPRDFTGRLIETIAASKKVCEHFHLPVQAGSDRILKKMNRGYTRDEYFNLIRTIKKYVPNATITTDILVGFPGEEDNDFDDTIDLVKQVRFDSAFTFIYNVRPGTPAADMEGQVPENKKTKRIQDLIELQNKISLEKNQEEKGRIQEILIEGENKKVKGHLFGRNRGNKAVFFPGEKSLIGKTVRVKINEAYLIRLAGEMVD